MVGQREEGWHTGTGFLPEVTWDKGPTGLCNSSSASSWPGAISLTVQWKSASTEEVPSTHAATCRVPVYVHSWGHTASKPGFEPRQLGCRDGVENGFPMERPKHV